MLLTFSTPDYADRLAVLLASCERNDPDSMVWVHCICWPDSQLLRARRRFPQYYFIPECGNDDIAADLAAGRRSGAVLRLKPTLLMNACDFAAPEGEPVVWVDADTVVTRPVAPMIARVDAEGDFGVTYRPGQRDHAKFAVAVMYFRHTPMARRVLQAYARETERTAGRGDWFHDQLALWEIYRRTPAARLVPLRDDEHTLAGNPDAIFVSRRTSFEMDRLRNLLTTKQITIPELT